MIRPDVAYRHEPGEYPDGPAAIIHGVKRAASEHYAGFEPSIFEENEGLVDSIELGCFRGLRARKRRGARRGIISGMLRAAPDSCRARGVPCHANRVLDTRMAAAECLAERDIGLREGLCGGAGARAVSAREPGARTACPRRGAGTTMAFRGRYPPDRAAEAGMAEWRGRGLAGEPRPTLQRVRPRVKRGASNSHSLVLVRAGAPEAGGVLRAFVLAGAFGAGERIPRAYGPG